METLDNTPQKSKKKISDMTWTMVGIAGLIVVLILLKLLMHSLNVV